MKYLTKSRFKTALECPAKLYYQARPKEYANAKLDDPFLEALAKGGFQVGALAQCYYPGGVLVDTLDKEEAVKRTNELLQNDNVVIFEAAIIYENLLVRVDILEKKRNKFKVIEVKSKSADPGTFYDSIWNKNKLKKGEYQSNEDWRSYLYDVAFQAHVVSSAFPESEVQSFLMLADKTKVTSVEGLHQKFFLTPDHKVVLKGDCSPKALGAEILVRIDVSEIVELIHSGKDLAEDFGGRGWVEGIKYLADSYESGTKMPGVVSKACRNCEFRCESPGLKSGFNECWRDAHGLTDEELAEPFVFDLWGGAGKALEKGKILLKDLDETDLDGGSESDKGLSRSQRRWLQVEKLKNSDSESFIDLVGLRSEFEGYKWPLHMIDFETCMVAIPFHSEKHPYQQLAFQFSHHIVHENGRVEHAGEYINCRPGEFPNFEFVRKLKAQLENDEGTIFRYSTHENTVLCQIREQLLQSSETDTKELVAFIESITTKPKEWVGPRSMVDLCDLVKRYYYSPLTKGSNSIKYVLPAVLEDSEYLKAKYSVADYSSNNFKNHAWLKLGEDGKVIDPYSTLGPISSRFDYDKLEDAMSEEESEIKNGGAAMTFYALTQFTEMSEEERKSIEKALLRYCELDTLGMCMIVEHWLSLLKQKKKSKTLSIA